MENRWDISKALDTKSPSPTIVSPIDGAEMVLVPQGPITMGITEAELQQIFLMDQRENPIFATEAPTRTIYLDSYYIDRYPVTNYQYRKFVQETGHREPSLWNHPSWGQPMQPVVFVGGDDARAYAKWAGKSLPTEAQWEKAGRGTERYWWSWGHEFLPDRCNSREYGLGRTSEIGLFDKGISPYGAMICVVMYGRCARVNGLVSICQCGGDASWALRHSLGSPVAGPLRIPLMVLIGLGFAA
ncbi:MAG: formylglycine-generating enzyme family protein [Pseudomonadota bacterium]